MKTLMQSNWILPSELPTLVSSHKGKPLLINHWATWCDPCLEELPTLAELHYRYGKDVTFLGLSWDRFEQFTDEQGTLDEIQRLAGEYDLRYNTLVFRGSPDELFSGLRMREQVVPQTMLYDADGEEVYHFTGCLADPDAQAELEGILNDLVR